MSAHYLTYTFDIHGGGMDLILRHHENEIAQRAISVIGFIMGSLQQMVRKCQNHLVTSSPLVRSKAHTNPFVYHPLALRYFLMGTHYRSPVNYSIEQIEIA
ncbi:unnamed protein product [Ilex paraguariensis]|uniref:tRNA synthetases class I catalytic domain-containing protein n=1 Tax=Ilex paraguariensis TaxID=185542 RepID=A0ABC8RWF7_9AQUA